MQSFYLKVGYFYEDVHYVAHCFTGLTSCSATNVETPGSYLSWPRHNIVYSPPQQRTARVFFCVCVCVCFFFLNAGLRYHCSPKWPHSLGSTIRWWVSVKCKLFLTLSGSVLKQKTIKYDKKRLGIWKEFCCKLKILSDYIQTYTCICNKSSNL